MDLGLTRKGCDGSGPQPRVGICDRERYAGEIVASGSSELFADILAVSVHHPIHWGSATRI
jgi:hypothetical protein